MLLDVDLGALLARHRARGDAVTLLLREDPRAESFGTIGVDAAGRVRRIGSPLRPRRRDARRASTPGSTSSRRARSATCPSARIFSHLDDWLAPLLAAGRARRVAELARPGDCLWEPVGTPSEYLAVNLRPLRLSYLDAEARGARARACASSRARDRRWRDARRRS